MKRQLFAGILTLCVVFLAAWSTSPANEKEEKRQTFNLEAVFDYSINSPGQITCPNSGSECRYDSGADLFVLKSTIAQDRLCVKGGSFSCSTTAGNECTNTAPSTSSPTDQKVSCIP